MKFMTTKVKVQIALLAVILLLMLAAGILLLRRSPERTHETSETLEDSAVRRESADSLAIPASARDESMADDPPATNSNPTITTSSENATEAIEPALSDTLRRYGSQATTMQMLIELLEEKQLLMEQKVELSRRLEIAEILDSALVHTAGAAPPPFEQQPQALELETEASLLRKLDSLSTLSPTRSDSSKTFDRLPPRN